MLQVFHAAIFTLMHPWHFWQGVTIKELKKYRQRIISEV
jgi:hypothetical protein